MNTQNTAHKKFPLYLRFPCTAEELLSSEAGKWGGADRGRTKTLHTADGGVYGRDYTLAVDLPAMGSKLYRLCRPTRTPPRPALPKPPLPSGRLRKLPGPPKSDLFVISG